MPTVLFADADRESRDLYAWLLSSYGFQVDTASDGLQCLAKLSHSLPDLLILDLGLPWGGGDGVLALIRQDLRLLPSRVVLASSVIPAQVLDNLVSPPVIQALSKPFQLSALFERAALEAFLEQEDHHLLRCLNHVKLTRVEHEQQEFHVPQLHQKGGCNDGYSTQGIDEVNRSERSAQRCAGTVS